MAVKRYSGTSWVTEAGAAAPLPSGMLAPFAGAAAPTGWLLCDGGTFSATAYPQLAAVLGNTYGVASGDNYYLPDLRGRTPIGAGTGTGLTARTLAATVGVESVTLTSAQSGVPAHSHANTVTNGDHGHAWTGQNSSLNNNGQGGNYPFKIAQDLQTQWTGTTGNISNSGGIVSITNVNNTAANAASSHENMQPSIVLNYIIKV